jgi:hypothetical protein
MKSKFFAGSLLPVLICLLVTRITMSEQQIAAIQLPKGEEGIGFDDLRYSSSLEKVLVPGGRTGMLDLIDPKTNAVISISGFSAQKNYGGGHGEGITSVDEAKSLLFVTDRSAKKLTVIDPGTKKIISSADLASSPDYVR